MSLKKPIYLDNQATTPTDPRVLEAMLPYFNERFGNAASTEHRFGWVAEEAVAQARQAIAESVGAEPAEILFTSGATESNNMAILGGARAYGRKGKHIVTLSTEHRAVLDPCAAWQREGGEVTYLGVEPDGLVDLERLAASLRDDTVLLSVLLANNEIGVIQPIGEIGALAHERGVLFHTDAAQAVGKVALNVIELNIDLMSLSGHKLYGPKGIGALYLRRKRPRVVLRPLVHGGGHERGLRSGTLNVPGIVGMATAIQLCDAERDQEQARILVLRQRLWQGLRERIPGLSMNGHSSRRLAGNLNVTFPNLSIADLVRDTYAGVAVSTGSACTSASPEPSHVLEALDPGGQRALSSLRFGLGRFTTAEEIEFVIGYLADAYDRLAAKS